MYWTGFETKMLGCGFVRQEKKNESSSKTKTVDCVQKMYEEEEINSMNLW